MTSRRFLITGGTQGIGAALVRLTSQKSHRVMFTGRDPGRLSDIGSETGARGVHADVGVEADNARVVDECLAHMGGVDVLINNAGVGYNAEIGSLELEAMRRLFDTNVFGMVDLTNRLAPAMMQQGQGAIVNLASTSGMKGGKGGTAYAASKWAIRGISQCWQTELRPHGIRVMCVCPSEVQTNWMGRTGRNNPNKLYAEDIAASIMAALDMPERVLWPEFAVFANNPWKED